jgi:hypothetical protein
VKPKPTLFCGKLSIIFTVLGMIAKVQGWINLSFRLWTFVVLSKECEEYQSPCLLDIRPQMQALVHCMAP